VAPYLIVGLLVLSFVLFQLGSLLGNLSDKNERPETRYCLESVMAWLYDHEINCSVSCFWDGGWDVVFGDEDNGRVNPALYQRTCVDSLTEAAVWLRERALAAFPDLANQD